MIDIFEGKEKKRMKKTTKVLGLLALAGTLAACGNQMKTGVIPDSDPYFPGKVVKYEYNSLVATAITELNYLKTQAGASATHFANFEDGLLLHNNFSVLEKNLATKVTQVNSYKQFDIDIRSGVKWVSFNGEQYAPVINGIATPQFVSANDFVSSAKAILTAPNASDTAYLIYNFIDGAIDYYEATYLMDKIANGGSAWAQYKDNAKFATKLNSLVKEKTGIDPNHTADEVDDIKNFKQVGIKVITEPGAQGGGSIRYTLKNNAVYFPTLLTYSCYLPVNEYFLKEIRFTNFGSAPDKLLYCGPYRLTKSSEVEIVYEKNESYWNLDKIHVDRIHYQVAPADASYDYTRTEFEQGRIDGFTISTKDTEGWQKYITGPQGTGTILNPYNAYVNSRDYDYIDYVYGLNVNVYRASNTRTGTVSGKSYATTGFGGSTATVKNTEKALLIKEVRDLIIASFDIKEYCKRNSDLPEYQAQYMINTYVPRGFVMDDNGNDYTKTHYYEEYGLHNLDKCASDTDPTKVDLNKVDAIIGQGQYDGVQVAYDDLAPLRDKATAAINAYNADNASSPITLPINLEFYTIWNDDETKAIDEPLILSMNQRINGMPTTTAFTKTTPNLVFYVIPTSDVTTSNYETVTNNGNFDICDTWGWGPDYGDPMSYLNTYAVGGDWSSIFGFVGTDCPNYHLDNGTLIRDESLLGDYTAKVTAASAEYEDLNTRFDLFAQAEYTLINELGIYKPLTMQGQGRQVSISYAAGYETPQGAYGLSSNRLEGLWVMVDNILRTDRMKAIKAFEDNKAAYAAAHGAINIY